MLSGVANQTSPTAPTPGCVERESKLIKGNIPNMNTHKKLKYSLNTLGRSVK